MVVTRFQSAPPVRPAGPFGAVAPRGVDGGRLDGADFYAPGRAAPPARPQPSRRLPLQGHRVGFETGVGAAQGAIPGCPLQLILLGPPGSGKTTQAEMLAEQLELPHISVGRLLRQEIEQGTELGEAVEKYVRAGELAPSALVFQVLEKRLDSEDIGSGFVIDGYPRELEQVLPFEELGQSRGFDNLQVVGLEVSDREVHRRLAARGRMDDPFEVIENRLEVYRESTSQVVDHFIDQGRYWVVDGEGSVAKVAERLKDCVIQWCPIA